MSNYPDGVTTSMIPGWRPEDVAWDSFYEDIDSMYSEYLDTMEEEAKYSDGEDAYESDSVFREYIDDRFNVTGLE